MIFEELAVGPLSVNCFVLGCESSHEGIVIDPGGDVELIRQVVQKHGLKISTVINTHGHFDHVGGNRQATSVLGHGCLSTRTMPTCLVKLPKSLACTAWPARTLRSPTIF